MDVLRYWNQELDSKTKIVVALLGISIGFYLFGLSIKALDWIYSSWKSRNFERSYPKLVVDLPEAASRSWKGKIIKNPHLLSHLDDSSLLPSANLQRSQKCVTAYDPSTGAHIQTIPLPLPSELTSRITLAAEAFPRHRATTFAQRRRFLRCFKDWVLRDLEGIVAVGCRDTGKTVVDSTFGEILTVLSKIDYLLKDGEAALSPEKRGGNLLLAHKVSKIHYEPLGTCLAIVSWNYPLHNALSPILASLFSGNTVVLKCSEQVYWSSIWIVEAIRKFLKICGMDEEAVQLVCCFPEDAEMILTDKRIKHITFIGSEPVGRKIAHAAAELMIPTCIELGGKDCALLLPNADVDFFGGIFMRAAFQAAGQNCIGIERFIIHESLLPRFLSIMTPRIASLRCGSDLSPSLSSSSPVDCGAMISSDRMDALEKILEEAVKDGAEVVVGGKRNGGGGNGGGGKDKEAEGWYFTPTLVKGVKSDMRLAQEEVFAPIMTILTYKTVSEAVEIANSTRYGLGSAVFGRSKKECRQVAKELEVGMVAINDFGVFYLNQAMPFGGVKSSGHGRFGGPEGLRGLCSIKAITEDRFFSWVQTSIPGPLDYPLPDPKTSWMFLHGLIHLAFGMSLIDRAKGIVGLIQAGLKGKGKK